MKILFDYEEGIEFPFRAHYGGHENETTPFLTTVGVRIGTYWQLLTDLVNQSYGWEEYPELEFSDYYDEEQKQIARLVIDMAMENKGLAGIINQVMGLTLQMPNRGTRSISTGKQPVKMDRTEGNTVSIL